jgi:TRAP transporter TAXI family solute receptor
VRCITAIIAAGLLLVVAGCGGPPQPPWRLVIATGGQEGVYYAYGEGLAGVARERLPGARPQVISTPASVENLRLVGEGRADVAFTLADSAALAFEGRAPFTERVPVVALARLYEDYTHLVVAADSSIRRLVDVKGRVVSLGAAGSGTELIATRLLTVAGMEQGDVRVRRLQIGDAADALRDGRVDAFFFDGGLPTGAIAELARVMPIRLIDLSAYVEPLRRRYGAFYEERSIFASAYGLDGQVRTVGVPNYLVVNASMADERAYQLTRLLFTRRDELAAVHPEALHLNRRSAVSTDPLPLHPGAMRYYREAKRQG